jgi:hypothetical protein
MFTTLFSTTFSGYTVVGIPDEVRGVHQPFAVWLLSSLLFGGGGGGGTRAE